MSDVEHFCTLFDGNFLPMGLCLYESLAAQAQPFKLWVLCMDEAVEAQLKRLALPEVSLIPLREVETPALRAVKPGRGRGEYCWTMTPFSFSAVLDRDPSVRRVTYLDADLYFFRNPRLLLQELDAAGKSVLITDHAYDPRYDLSAQHGRFCVQFVTFTRSPGALAILRRWQDQCVEWCFNRDGGPGRFGDQKYLDEWPGKYPDEVHVLRRTEATLAPWNVACAAARAGGRIEPVFYHFHGLRILPRRRVQLYWRYRVGAAGRRVYRAYLEALSRAARRLEALGVPLPTLRPDWGRLGALRALSLRLAGTAAFGRLP